MRFINREENRVAEAERKLSALQRMQGASGRVLVTGQNVTVAASRVDRFDVALSPLGTGGGVAVATVRLRNPFASVAKCVIEDVSGPSPAFDRGESCDDDLSIKLGNAAATYLYGGGSPEVWSSARAAKSLTLSVPPREQLTLSLIDTDPINYFGHFTITWSIS